MYSLGEIGCMVREMYCAPKTYTFAGTLYKFNEQEEGLSVEYWQPEALGGPAVAHDDVTAIFGPTLSAHPNPPSFSYVTQNLNITTASGDLLTAGGYPDRNSTNGTDQIRITFFTCSDIGFDLIDSNTNTGERGAAFINGALVAEDTTDSVAADRAAVPPISLNAGVNCAVIATADLSAWQGYRPDGPEGVSFYPAEPTWESMPVFKCDDLSGGFVDCDGSPVEIGPKDYWSNAPQKNVSCPASGGGEPMPQTVRIL